MPASSVIMSSEVAASSVITDGANTGTSTGNTMDEPAAASMVDLVLREGANTDDEDAQYVQLFSRSLIAVPVFRGAQDQSTSL